MGCNLGSASRVALVGLYGLLFWFFALSGPVRFLIDSGSRIVTGVMTLFGTVAGIYVLFYLRDRAVSRVALFLILLNVAWIALVSALAETPLWTYFAGLGIVLFAPAVLSLGAGLVTGSDSQIWIRGVWLLLAVNLVVITLQLVFAEGIDRGVGLLGNERASNTIGIFLVLASLGLWLRAEKFFSLAFAGFITAVVASWLGDAKASLGLLLISLFVFTVALAVKAVCVSSSVHNLELRKLTLATLMIGVATQLAFQGVFTVSRANFGPEVRVGIVEMYTAPAVLSQSTSSNLTQTKQLGLLGDGFGTGASYLGKLLVEGHLEVLPGSTSLAQRNRELASARSLDTRSTGLFYSPYRTMLGVLDEMGVVGLILYFSAIVAALFQFRRSVGFPGLLAVLALLLPSAALTPFLEYPEVTLSVVVFLVLLNREPKASSRTTSL